MAVEWKGDQTNDNDGHANGARDSPADSPCGRTVVSVRSRSCWRPPQQWSSFWDPPFATPFIYSSLSSEGFNLVRLFSYFSPSPCARFVWIALRFLNRSLFDLFPLAWSLGFSFSRLFFRSFVRFAIVFRWRSISISRTDKERRNVKLCDSSMRYARFSSLSTPFGLSFFSSSSFFPRLCNRPIRRDLCLVLF